MSERSGYQPGVPCWVDTLAGDTAAARSFYSELLGWEFVGPGPMDYCVARVRGRDVAGVGTRPEGVPPAWHTYVSVASAKQAAEVAVAAGGDVVTAPFDALPAGRLAVIADPSGATFGVWEPREREGAQRVNEAGAWAMSMLHTDRPDSCQDFYAAVFGWEVEEFAPGMSLFRLPGYVGGEPAQPVPRDVVAVMSAGEESPGYWRVGFWVQDADEVAARAPGLGGQVIAPPFDGGGMRQATVADPAGAAFGVTTAPHG